MNYSAIAGQRALWPPAPGEKTAYSESISDLRDRPYLSIVTISRNDDYGGGDALSRMEVAFRARLEQLDKFQIESEMILIDWNPPPDRPLLKDALRWPDNLRYTTIRVIEVPPSIHQRYEYSDKIALNGIVALNCGIRRARGEFILPAHIDLLYSNELMSEISLKTLKKAERYRVERCDVDRNVVHLDSLREKLDYCRNNIIKIKAFRPRPRPRFGCLRKSLPDLFTSASGDFQLMSKYYWHLLRGYSEAHMVGAYVDSILSYASYAAGVREVVLNPPMRLYHIDHDGKFNDSIVTRRLPLENLLSSLMMPQRLNTKIVSLWRRFLVSMGYKIKSSVKGIPTLEYSEYREICREIVAGKHTHILNDENWGLGEESFEEFVINVADWEEDYGRN